MTQESGHLVLSLRFAPDFLGVPAGTFSCLGLSLHICKMRVLNCTHTKIPSSSDTQEMLRSSDNREK